jgi:glycine/D-amino acid oxidase-like deaminating enzyme
MYDALIIGGGFYGCSIAIYLAKERGFKKIALVEREGSLLSRASYSNQARVHNGYHYPRSFTTAFRSRVNLPKFVDDFSSAVKTDFLKLYAIARRNSKVNSLQFRKFCKEIGAKLETAPNECKSLFEKRLIEDVFLVEEYAFNTEKLCDWAITELRNNNVEIHYKTEAKSIFKNKNALSILLTGAHNNSVDARFVFNCTYSGLNQISGDFPGTETKLKHEITEMALVDMPFHLKNIGVTVMDGAFFSMMPFPARGLHTLSHVRYTPHFHWEDKSGENPYEKLAAYPKISRFDWMLRDVKRYIPSINEASQKDSLFEIKTVLIKNESDDGRPILFEKSNSLNGLYSILGGKIDNIYDVLERLDRENFSFN